MWGGTVAVVALNCIGSTVFYISELVTMAHWRCVDCSNAILFRGSFETILQDLHYGSGMEKCPNYAINL